MDCDTALVKGFVIVVNTEHRLNIIQRPDTTEETCFLDDELQFLYDEDDYYENCAPGVYIADLSIEWRSSNNSESYGEIDSIQEFINFIPILNFPYKNKSKKKIRRDKKRMELLFKQFDWS